MPFNHLSQWLRRKGVWVLLAVVMCAMLVPGKALAAGNDFNIQVSPSPLVVTLTPGKQQTASLTIRNLTNHPETLYPKLNGFTIDKSSKDVRLQDTPPVGMDQWITFKSPSITLAAGATQTVDVVFNTPNNVGFSYSLAITLARKQDNVIDKDGVHLQGAVAVFCLVNIDRADAKRELSISSFKANKSQYQYLPANFTLTVKNTGNIIDQPKGTLYIQRSYGSNKPLTTMPINTGSNYVLPGTSRDFTSEWKSGFPAYVKGADGKQHLSWDWKHLSDLRFGRYVAKVVLVYNDGHRDVPLVASYTFWVIPWTLILILLVLAAILVAGFVGWGRLIVSGTKKVRKYAHRK